MILHPMMYPAEYIGEIARLALIAEVDTTPKPGLVDRQDNGAHNDMNHSTFLSSANAIAPYLVQMAGAGYNWVGTPDKLFAYIRPIGILAEQAMYQATGGVNTHKGLIFSLGILCACAGQYHSRHGCFRSLEILTLAREMTSQTLEKEFEQIRSRGPKTHGERLYCQYGIRGIRGEASEGYPSVRDCALPKLAALNQEISDQNLLFLQTLLHLMAHVEDTNVMFRTNVETAAMVRKEAERILKLGGCLTALGMAEIQSLNKQFIRQNISPGGCADLLAVTIFLWMLDSNKTIQMQEEVN